MAPSLILATSSVPEQPSLQCLLSGELGGQLEGPIMARQAPYANGNCRPCAACHTRQRSGVSRTCGGVYSVTLIRPGSEHLVSAAFLSLRTSVPPLTARSLSNRAIYRREAVYSGRISPDPPISLGMSFILGRPSLMRRTVSP